MKDSLENQAITRYVNKFDVIMRNPKMATTNCRSFMGESIYNELVIDGEQMGSRTISRSNTWISSVSSRVGWLR